MVDGFYRNFSQIYDSVMDQSLYDDWLAFTCRHVSENAHSILELACGSGELSLRLDSAGFAVTGLDISEDMLVLAKKKLPHQSFILKDMRDFAAIGKFDAVTCYSDSLCYLSSLIELQQVIENVYEYLDDSGVFIFDVHSTYQMDEIFPGYSYHENAEDFAFLWDSFADEVPHSIVHELTFFVKESDEKFVRLDEVHHERTYEMKEYLSVLKKFDKVKVCADFTDEKPDEKSTRWFFVCQK